MAKSADKSNHAQRTIGRSPITPGSIPPGSRFRKYAGVFTVCGSGHKTPPHFGSDGGWSSSREYSH